MRLQVVLLSALVTLAVVPTQLAAQETERRFAVYDVGSILRAPVLSGGILPPLPALRLPQGERVADSSAMATPVSLNDESPEGDSAHRPKGGPWLSPHELQILVSSLVAEESWSNRRNEVLIQDGRLRVVQTTEVIAQVESFLAALEERALRQVAVELALLPPSVLDKVAPGWDRPGASPWLEDGSFDRALTAAGADAVVFSTRAPPGAWKRLSPEQRSAHIVDHDVNQSGVIAVVDPVVGAVPIGGFAELRVFPSPDGTWHRVDLRLGESRKGGAPRTQRFEWGEVDLLEMRDAHVATSLVAPAGRTVVAGVWAPSPEPAAGSAPAAAPSFVGLVRVRGTDPGVANVDRAKATPLSVVEAGLLTAPLRSFSIHRPDDYEDWYSPMGSAGQSNEGPALVAAEVLEAYIDAAVEETGIKSVTRRTMRGSVFLSDSETTTAAVKRRLESLARERAALIVLDLVQLSLDAGELTALGGAGSFLEPAQVEAAARHAVFRCRMSGLGGVEHSLAAVASRSSLQDIEFVSGGTSSSSIEVVGDPIVRSAGEGLVLNARAEGVPGSPWVQLRLSGEVARPPRFGRQVKLPASQSVKAPSGERTEELMPEGPFASLELPEEDSDRIEHLVTLPQGKPLVLSAVPDGARPGRTKVLVATISAFSVGEGGGKRRF